MRESIIRKPLSPRVIFVINELDEEIAQLKQSISNLKAENNKKGDEVSGCKEKISELEKELSNSFVDLVEKKGVDLEESKKKLGKVVDRLIRGKS